MRWSTSQQRIASKLQAIESARRRAAEANLLAARSEAAVAERTKIEAQTGLGEAEHEWQSHLCSHGFDLELGKAFAAQLLDQQRQFDHRTQALRDAEYAFEEKRRAWQKLEAAVRSGDVILRRGRRHLLKRLERARDHDISERTTWSWFRP